MSDHDPHHRDRTFLARYGATILRGGIAAIPSALYRYQNELDLPPQLVWFISAILSHKWDADMPHPSLKRLAKETGVSEQQLHTYKKQLVERGWLCIINRRGALGGQDTNFYDFSALFGRLEELLQRDKPDGEEGGLNHSLAGGLKSNLAPGLNAGSALIEPVTSEAKQRNISKLRKGKTENLSENGESPGAQLRDGESTQHIPQITSTGPNGDKNSDYWDMSPMRSTIPARASEQHAPNDAGFHRLRETVERMRKQHVSDDQVSTIQPERGSRGRPPGSREERDIIAAYLSDFMREFNDQAPLSASITRALHLFKQASIPKERFGDYLYQARSLTKENVQRIKTKVKKEGSVMPTKNQVPYFFAILEDLLHLRTEESTQPNRFGSAP